MAAAEEEVPAMAALNEPAGKAMTGLKANKREEKSNGGEVSVVDAEEVLAVQQGAPGMANRSGPCNETYAPVARGNAPPRDFAYQRRDAQAKVNIYNTPAQQTHNAKKNGNPINTFFVN